MLTIIGPREEFFKREEQNILELNPHFSPGGPSRLGNYWNSIYLTSLTLMVINRHAVLSGFWNNLAAHLERSALSLRITKPLRPIVQPALPACPKIPDPGEKYGLKGLWHVLITFARRNAQTGVEYLCVFSSRWLLMVLPGICAISMLTEGVVRNVRARHQGMV
jgi:hypothetical protein